MSGTGFVFCLMVTTGVNLVWQSNKTAPVDLVFEVATATVLFHSKTKLKATDN